MAVVGIDHVQLAMPAGGEEQARGFYRDVLGLTEQPKPAALAERGGCWFANGAVQVHVGVDPDFRPAGKAHVGLLVDALAPVVDACRARGFAVAAGEPLDGCVRAYVHDPFGNRIELLERMG